MNTPTDEILHQMWRDLRDDYQSRIERARGALYFALFSGQLTAEQHELWARRLETCPGHDDEGGRDWCAYGCKLERGE